MEQFSIVLNQTGIFFIIILTGFGIIRFKLVPEDSLPVISKLFTRVILPFVIFINNVNGASRADVINYSYLLLVSICMYAALTIIARIMPKALKLKGNRASLFSLSNTFGNVGFIGIPLLLAVYGQRSMIVVAMYSIADQFLLWTYGFSLTFPEDNKLKFSVKTLKNTLNPALTAVILSLVIIMLDIDLPKIINQSFITVANAGTALPFLYIGGMVATSKVQKLLKFREFYVGIAVKMIILPICAFCIMSAAGFEAEIIGTTVILIGLPAVGMMPMLAGANGSDAEYATAAVIVTTLASLVTLTLVSYITGTVIQIF
ncbi:MAG: AEC family transporter [Oscillospiraceae bacterium]|nr:AEC family transporter [Oscillospiraceae bacterium]